MRFLSVFAVIAAPLTLAAPSPASAETYQEYLTRLRDVCAVDCMQPREFQLAARKRASRDADGDMALIMDVNRPQRGSIGVGVSTLERVQESISAPMP